MVGRSEGRQRAPGIGPRRRRRNIMTDKEAFSGIRFLDISQGVAGPHSGMLLAQHGADVIKVEPIAGDWGRTLGRPYGQNTAHSIAFNRGKRSIALDLTKPRALEVARML